MHFRNRTSQSSSQPNLTGMLTQTPPLLPPSLNPIATSPRCHSTPFHSITPHPPNHPTTTTKSYPRRSLSTVSAISRPLREDIRLSNPPTKTTTAGQQDGGTKRHTETTSAVREFRVPFSREPRVTNPTREKDYNSESDGLNSGGPGRVRLSETI